MRTSQRQPRLWATVPLAAAVLIVAVALPSYADDGDTQAPTVPGQPVATEVTTSSATLTWSPSTDNVGVTDYEVMYFSGNSDVAYLARTPTNSITLPGTPSITLLVRVRALDAAGNTSAFTDALRVTLAPGDSQPPTAPGTPVASDVTETSVTLTWARSTDNVQGEQGIQVYEVLRIDGATETVISAVPQAPAFPNSTTLRNLSPATTYVFAVRARDYAGNTSERSGPVTVTTLGSAASCTATYHVTSQWPGGFVGEVVVANPGTATTHEWTVGWTFPNGQTIGSLWSGRATTTGASVSVRNESWNGSLAPSATTTFGFIGTWSGSNAVPSPLTCTSA